MSAEESAIHHEVHTLYDQHHGWLLGMLRRKMGNPFDAADLSHDTFIRLLAREELVTAKEPRAFLTTIAQGLVANFYRRKKIELAYLETLAGLPEPQVPSPENRMVLLETLVEIDRRLDGLAIPVRKAFLLSQLDGMGQADIAKALGISLATVQRYIVKAVHQCYFPVGE